MWNLIRKDAPVLTDPAQERGCAVSASYTINETESCQVVISRRMLKEHMTVQLRSL